jgi:hypothetical protein
LRLEEGQRVRSGRDVDDEVSGMPENAGQCPTNSLIVVYNETCERSLNHFRSPFDGSLPDAANAG